MNNPAKQATSDLNASLKLAIALAVIKSRRRQKLPSSSTADCNGETQAIFGDNSESDAFKWKIKAKQRKEEILKLKEDLKIAEDGVHHDLFPQNISCKCYFCDNLGQLSPSHESDQKRFSDVLRRRFLRQVRLSERKRRRHGDCLVQPCISDSAVENEMEQLRASVDFLVELCETSSPTRVEESNFKIGHTKLLTLFSLLEAALKALSMGEKIDEAVESIVNSLIVRLIRRMCNGSQGDELVQCNKKFQFYVQHLLRNLGRDPYVGQRVILSVSQRISISAESLRFMDPFDGAFPKIHNSMYTMIQLIDFLVSDYFISWPTRQEFDSKLLEEWVVSVFHARKPLELLESRNALYINMDCVLGDLTRHLGPVPFVQMLPQDTVDKLFG